MDTSVLWVAAGFACAIFIVYSACLIIYRLYFSPLAQFPGPKLVAATAWYETFIDVTRNNFHEVLLDMHKKYEYFSKLYVPAGIRHTNSMVARFGFGLEGSFVRLDQAYSAYLGDITVELTVGESSQLLEEPDFAPECILLVNPVIRNFPLLGRYGILIATLMFHKEATKPYRLLMTVPMSCMQWAFPRIAAFKMWPVLGRDKVNNVKSDLAKESDPEKFSFFHTLLRSDLPEYEKHPSRLAAEAVGVFGGGTINPTSALAFITFHILANANMHRRLQESLSDVMSQYPKTIPAWTEFEQVPYLAACVKEGLR
ncbi:uncharacterized protein N0V89_007770 [Didymosphaeria variabile]|uniref:Cytochrome P450 n=1 Tax=Didymosphaeria variabile TaxID=1932322 RepID=A0A9W9CAS5_9PLEO|nr:uncharacterized protein N0V89_007770 [Didymosphaeria variabile]KAJ4352422.1 hypothetical protein N0V89_007770 [Didymosphaeria variabile]